MAAKAFSKGEKLGFVSAIRAAAACCPDRDALRYEGQSMSWGDLCDRAARIAGGVLTPLNARWSGVGGRIAKIEATYKEICL